MVSENKYKLVYSNFMLVLPNLLISILVMTFFIMFRIHSTLIINLVMIDLFLLYSYLIKKKEERPTLKKLGLDLLNLIIVLNIILIVFRLFSYYGFIGICIFIMLLSFYIMFGSKKKRDNFFQQIKNIEVMMFGKSLDKENWNKHKPKIKIVWGKKK